MELPDLASCSKAFPMVYGCVRRSVFALVAIAPVCGTLDRIREVDCSERRTARRMVRIGNQSSLLERIATIISIETTRGPSITCHQNIINLFVMIIGKLFDGPITRRADHAPFLPSPRFRFPLGIKPPLKPLCITQRMFG